MIIKKNFNPLKVILYIKTELAFALCTSLLAYLLSTQQVVAVNLPFSVSAIMGSALAIFIAFRNNSAYGRWWEARTQWAGIHNAARVFTRLVITFTDSHKHQPNYDAQRGQEFKEFMIYKLIAWAHALRIQLRNQNNWHELKTYFSEAEYEALALAQNKPNHIQLISAQKIYEAMANGTLGGFDSFQMEGQLLALTNYQGNCERIKSTPLLRQYHYFTKLFFYAFCLLLPFSLIADFHKMGVAHLLIPVSLIISMVFAIIGKVGEVNEDPFENKITDVPLSAICNTLEREVLEMLGKKDLPPNYPSVKGYLY